MAFHKLEKYRQQLPVGLLFVTTSHYHTKRNNDLTLDKGIKSSNQTQEEPLENRWADLKKEHDQPSVVESFLVNKDN